MAKTPRLATLLAAGSIALAPLQAAQANDLLKGLVGAGIAVGVGCASGVLNCKRNQRRTTTTRRSSGVSTAQRQQNREVQSALNYFGWNVGTVDGALGSKSRAGISNYQAYMGYPITGRLTDYERQQLVGGWQRTQAGGGSAYGGVVANEGTRGLLHAYRDGPNAFGGRYNNGVGVNAPTTAGYVPNSAGQQPAYPGTGAAAQQPVFPGAVPPTTVAGVQGQQVPSTQVVTPSRGLAALPLAPLMPAPIERSMSSHCDAVATQARINGGGLQPLPANPSAVLDGQFCRARTVAMDESAGLFAGLQGVTDDQLAGHCAGLAETLAPQANAVSVKGVDVVTQEVQQALLATGADLQQYVGTGKICLGYGFRTDSPDVTLASALILSAAGQTPYGEILGHQLYAGFGVTRDENAARSWYETAFRALDQGAQPAFLPAESQARVSQMREALNGSTTNAAGSGLAPLPTTQ